MTATKKPVVKKEVVKEVKESIPTLDDIKAIYEVESTKRAQTFYKAISYVWNLIKQAAESRVNYASTEMRSFDYVLVDFILLKEYFEAQGLTVNLLKNDNEATGYRLILSWEM